MTIKPWKVLSSRRLHRNIRLDACELPDHRVYDVTVLEFGDWVTILALTPDGQVVLERQYRHGLQKVILELPGGCRDAEDQTPLDAARRELLEETGFTSDKLIPLGCISADPSNHNNLMHAFLALDAERTSAQHLDTTEEIDVLLKPLDEVIAMAKSGELPQALHLSTLFLALAYLGRLT